MKPDWKPGNADTTWKVIVCARDVNRVDEIIKHMCYVLTGAGSNEKLGLELLSKMTGKEIIDGLLAYKDCAVKSIEAGLKSGKGDGNVE